MVMGLPAGSVQSVRSSASMAGLPASSAWVRVGPPLSWRAPSRGSPVMGCRPEIAQPAGSPTRLGAAGVSEPLQSGPVAAVFPARMVLASVAVPEIPPPLLSPPLPLAELPVMVLL